MSIEGQGHFFTIYFPGFVCFVLYLAKISGERLQDHWSSSFVRFAADTQKCEGIIIIIYDGQSDKFAMFSFDSPPTILYRST